MSYNDIIQYMENSVEKYDLLAFWLYVVLDGCVLSMLWCVYKFY